MENDRVGDQCGCGHLDDTGRQARFIPYLSAAAEPADRVK